MRRTGLPGGQEAITFRWGTPGNGEKYKGGSGLSHIIAKHGIEVVEDVVETIAKGKIIPRSRNRVNILSRETLISLALIKNGKHESWVLTGFTKGQPSVFFNLRKLTGSVFFKGS